VTPGTDVDADADYPCRRAPGRCGAQRRGQEVTMAHIIGLASIGALLTATVMVWENSHPQQTDAIAGVSPVWLSINEIGAKVDAKSLPEQHIEDRTLIFVGP
jgi:hypothetical protein